MRGILFKAKRVDNGEWVVGQYVKKCDRCFENYKHYGDDPLRSNAIRPMYRDRKNMSTIGFKIYNLCPKCIESFEEWFDGGK